MREPEAEDLLLDEALVDEVVPHWGDSVNRDRFEGKSEDSVELGRDEGDSWLFEGLSKGLSGDGESSNVDSILRKESTEGSSSVLDGEGSSVGDISRRLRAVVLVVSFASNVGRWAFG